jgi:hypothetical protein
MIRKKSGLLTMIGASAFLTGALTLAATSCTARSDDLSLWKVYESKLKPRQFIDLTHLFVRHPPLAGFPAEREENLYIRKYGFFAELFKIGQWRIAILGHFQRPPHAR